MNLFSPSTLAPEPLRVLGVVRETHDVVTLTLDAPGERASFRPGQFNMLYAFGVGEAAISLSGDPSRSAVLVHTIRDVGAVSHALSQLEPGDYVGVRGPYGTPWPMDAAVGGDLVIIAGGLGLAPLRPAVYHALLHRTHYRRVFLLAGARAPAELPFQNELESWARSGNLDVLVTVDHAPAGWNGRVGVVPSLLSEIDLAPDATAFVCGPEIMMHFTERELTRRGVPEQRIYLSIERNMKCALGFCGHCQLGPEFLCKDGPVLRFDRVRPWFRLKEA